MKLKAPLSNIATISLDLYLLAVFLFSGSVGFIFFVDSRTYLEQRAYVSILSPILTMYPIGSIVLSASNILLLRRIILQHRINLVTLSMLSPYSLMLISNSTKEAILFLFMAGAYLLLIMGKPNSYRIFATIISSIGIVVRPIYLPLVLAWLTPRYLVVVTLVGVVVGLLSFDTLQVMIGEFLERLSGRHNSVHTGRDFFNYLCVAEKANLSEFAFCWTSVFWGLPVHDHTLSLLYIPYAMFQIPYVLIVFTLFTSRNMTSLYLGSVVLSLHFVIFLHAPTFGAFIRYAYPVLWFASLYALHVHGLRFRSLVLRKNPKL